MPPALTLVFLDTCLLPTLCATPIESVMDFVLIQSAMDLGCWNAWYRSACWVLENTLVKWKRLMKAREQVLLYP
jgi:hypothetical protein